MFFFVFLIFVSWTFLFAKIFIEWLAHCFFSETCVSTVRSLHWKTLLLEYSIFEHSFDDDDDDDDDDMMMITMMVIMFFTRKSTLCLWKPVAFL